MLTDEPVPPTLNEIGSLTVPNALIFEDSPLFTTQLILEKVVKSSPAWKVHVAYLTPLAVKSTEVCVVINLKTQGMTNVNVSPGLASVPSKLQPKTAVHVG